MKRNLFAIFLALALVVALAFVVAPNAQAETMTVVQATGHGKMTVAEGQILDLNGYNVEVETDATISVINTSFITESGLLLGGNHPGSLTITGNGSPKDVVTDGKFQYLAVATTGDNVTTYNFHPFNLGITKLGLNTLGKNGENPAVCIEVMFIANDVVKAKLESDGYDYGLEKLSGDNKGPISVKGTRWVFGEKANGTRAYYDLTDSLTANIDNEYEFQAYITIPGIDKPITNNPISFIPREVLKGINKGIALNEGEDKITPSPAQKDRIVALMKTNTRMNNIFDSLRTKSTDYALSFSDTANRTASSTEQQTWQQNGITLIYDKAASTQNLAENHNPVRFYANTKLTINVSGIAKIVFDCNSNSYANALSTSIGVLSGVTVSTNSDKVTVTFDSAVDTFTIAKLSTQVRMDSLTVTTGSPDCTHEVHSAKCEVSGKCLDCDNDVAALEHTGGTATCNSKAVCTICNDEYGSIDADAHPEASVTAATCTKQAYCSECDTSFGETAPHNYKDGKCTECDEDDPNTGKAPELLATFTLGADGSASHADGSNKTTYSETVDGYKLDLKNCSNFYTSARDAMGNSCIKLGASSKAGSFSFTVPDNVTQVTIYVAKYKSNTTKVTVNGTTTTLTKNSDDGAYDAITVDTTTNKTVSVTTVSGGYRAMMNTIEFTGYAN